MFQSPPTRYQTSINPMKPPFSYGFLWFSMVFMTKLKQNTSNGLKVGPPLRVPNVFPSVFVDEDQKLPSGYVKIALENCHGNSGSTNDQLKNDDFP